MSEPVQHRRVIPLHRVEPTLRRVEDEAVPEGAPPIEHPATAEARRARTDAPVVGFWNNVPVRHDEPDTRPNPLTWALVKARRDRMKAYLPIIEVATMLMLTLIGVLVEHFALLVFGDWK
jgi:hypothetical protein